MGDERGQRDLPDRIQWVGEHDLLDAAKEKSPLECFLLHSGCGARSFRIDVSASPAPRATDPRRYTVRVYLENDQATREWLTLEGGHGRGWIPQFGQPISAMPAVAAAASSAKIPLRTQILEKEASYW